MRVIIAGSRSIRLYNIVASAVRTSSYEITTVISGTAYGVDQLGERWAKEHNVPCELFPADWDRYGRSAGYKRNELMAQNADALIAVWDGLSRGTKHMIDIMNKLGKPVHIYQVADTDYR